MLWFSSGGSKSHLHVDTVENINCMISGSKKWFLVDKVCSFFLCKAFSISTEHLYDQYIQLWYA